MQALGPYSQKALMLGLFVEKFQPILMFDIFVLVWVASQWQRAFKNKTLCEFGPWFLFGSNTDERPVCLRRARTGTALTCVAATHFEREDFLS